MSSSTTPTTTPIRPARSLARLSMAASSTNTLVASLEDPLTPPLPSSSTTPGSAASFPPQTPPGTPASPSQAHVNNRKSVSSIRRKPVPLSLADEHELEMAQLHTARSAPMYSAAPPSAFAFTLPPGAAPPSSPNTNLPPLAPQSPESAHTLVSSPEPPRYVLPVDLPPSFHHSASSSSNPFGVDTSIGSTFTLQEDLPRYAEETQTEPKTLARGLWRWGFVCPLLWFIGMTILWIPLRPVEEEEDAEKAQKLEEMIVILRRTELKYAKRCAYAFAIFIGIIVGIVCIVVGVEHATHHL